MRQILPIQSIGVIAESELSTSARLVAVMLMYHVNRKNGLCYPSLSTLALECGCQPTTIKKALAELKELGFVEWETKTLPRTSTRVNHYNLLFAHWSENDQRNDQRNDQPNDWPSGWSNIDHKPKEPKEPKEQKNPHTPQGELVQVKPARVKAEYPADFEEFWRFYPRKNGKDAALRAWKAKKREGRLPALSVLSDAIDAAKRSDQWQRDGGQYIPHPATWLNQGRWMDEQAQEDPVFRIPDWARSENL